MLAHRTTTQNEIVCRNNTLVQCRSCPVLGTKGKERDRTNLNSSEIISVTWLDFSIRTCKICVFILWYSHCLASWPLIAWPFSDCVLKHLRCHTNQQWDTAFAVTVTFRSTISLCLHFIEIKDFNTYCPYNLLPCGHVVCGGRTPTGTGHCANGFFINVETTLITKSSERNLSSVWFDNVLVPT